MSIRTEPLPLVSVVIPTYNYAHYIGDALRSVQAQTYGNWECVVVDDGSTDDTEAVVADFAARDGRISYVRQANARQAAARNNGIRRAAGEYFQFLDADDMIEPEKLERQLRFLRDNPAVDIVYSDIRYFDADDPASVRRAADPGEEPWMPQISGSGREFMMRLVRNNIMPINAPLIPRAVVERVGPFDEDLTPVEDWAYHVRCAAAGFRYRYDDGEGVRPLVRTTPGSSSSDPRRMLRAEIRMRRSLRRVLKDAAVYRLNEDRLAEVTGLLGVEEHLHGRRARAVAQFVRAGGMERRGRHRAKWMLCAAAGLFAGPERIRRLVNTSVSEAFGGLLRRG
jgi:glycosyltransferase involved in cell wall biosynthesis